MQRTLDYHLFGTHVVFGRGCSASLPTELDAIGCDRPAILMQRKMAASPQWERLRAELGGLTYRVYEDVPTHGNTEWAEAVAGELANSNCDSIVAIGGGSVSDSAKAVAMLVAEGGTLGDHATCYTPPATIEIPRRVTRKLPIIALPTTASGAEVTPSFAAREGGHKLLFWNRALAATTILIDPALSTDVPVDLMRYTAMNGLAHCFEGMYSVNRSVISDALAVQGVELLAKALCLRSRDEDDQRALLLLGGHVSGMVLSMAKTCLHHAICHVIGARHFLGHGVVNTVVLPHAIRFNEETAAECLKPALATLNRVACTHHESVSNWLEATATTLHLPRSLTRLGIEQSDLPAIAQQTMTERGLALNPRPVSHPSEILSILEQAL